MQTAPKRQYPGAFTALAIAILLAAFALRVVALTGLPLFVDESSHIFRAFRVTGGELFIGFQHHKWLYTVVLALFQPGGPESVWLARTVSALSSLLTVATAIALGRLLARRADSSGSGARAGLAAGLIYAALPMAVFHERQALVDPMLVAFTALATLFAMRLAYRPRLALAALLALALAGAMLTKTSALPYLALPLMAALLLARRRDLPRALALGALAGAVAGGAFLLLDRAARRAGAVIPETHRLSAENTFLSDLTSPGALAAILSNLANAGEALAGYVGFGVLALAALALVLLVRGVARREIVFLAVPAIAFLIPPVLVRQVTAGGYLPPRYLLPNTLPLVALAALTLHWLVGSLRRVGHNRARRALGWLAPLAVILIPALRFDAITIADPLNTPFTPIDERQYLGNYDGPATQQIAAALLDEWRSGDAPQLGVIGPTAEVLALHAYLGPRVGIFEDPRSPGLDPARLIIDWLATSDAVYIVRDHEEPDIPYSFADVVTEHAGTFGSLDLLRVTGLNAALADALYTRLAGQPQFMTADYDALAAELAADPTPRTVIVFPAGHASALAARVDLAVVPLSLNVWPPAPQATRAALSALYSGGSAAEPVDVVFVNPQTSDPERVVALGIRQTLYSAGEMEWVGVFQRRRFVTGPATPSLSPAATFEDVIDLSAALVDEEAQPGGALRIAVSWQTAVPVEDSFKVFAHLLDDTGALRAQHDAFPVSGLLPTTAWPPGEPVSDRFAILLPPDLPPGAYEVRIGLYNPENGLRLRVSGGGDSAAIGAVTVGQPGR